MSVEALSERERSELGAYERVIAAGRESVGAALAAIRDQRLYRITHKTFEAYCQERWGMTANYVYKKIAAAETAKSLCTTCTQSPSEGALRPVTTLRTPEGEPDVETQREVLREAQREAGNGKITSRHTKAAITKITRAANGEGELAKKRNEWKKGSQAEFYAKTAIHHLERIEADDPKRRKAVILVREWCNQYLNKKENARRNSPRRRSC